MAKALAALLAFGMCIWPACSGGDGASGGSGSDVRQSSPQEAARGFKDATINRNWERVFAYLTRKAQEAMVGAAYITGAYGAQTDLALAQSYATLAEKHGLSGKDAELKQDADLTQIYIELVGWIEDNLPEEHGGNLTAMMAEQMAATEFSDFKVDGDRARAQMLHTEGPREMRFKKIEGRWFID